MWIYVAGIFWVAKMKKFFVSLAKTLQVIASNRISSRVDKNGKDSNPKCDKLYRKVNSTLVIAKLNAQSVEAYTHLGLWILCSYHRKEKVAQKDNRFMLIRGKIV